MTPEEEAYVLAKAYVPEHIVSLMTLLSGGEAFLIEDYLGFAGDDWLILVGYPFERPYSGESCEQVVEQALRTHRPGILRFIGPELPPGLKDSCAERQSDAYYLLDLDGTPPKPSLLRTAAKAGRSLSVERERAFSRDHERLAREFLGHREVTPSVRALYEAMPGYTGRSPTAWTLSARDVRGRLCAFFVVDLGAAAFSTFLLGARSLGCEAPHASDLLFSEMIEMTRESGKTVINLGLGVHAGIRRFKEKWGGRPALRYEFCERRYAGARKVSLWSALLGKL
jgi:hypothetical protein